ncbi:MAG TPA: hypothetical protein VGM74_08870 [Burkholderiaceae bacterium]|jgi:hypothetical protein
MTVATHSARIVQPIPFIDALGQHNAIPVGPCLVEELDTAGVSVFWGPTGEESALLPAEEVEVAESTGKLVLLD